MWVSGFFAAQNQDVAVKDIPWYLYTQVVHFAAAPTPTGGINLFYLTAAEIADFQTRPASTKALVCLKDAYDLNFFKAATTPKVVATLVQSLADFINQNKYDGVEIDWEANVIPAQYVDFITKLRAKLGSSKTIAMSAGDWGGLQEVASKAQSALDQINVMCYDLDNSWNPSWFNCSTIAGASGQRSAYGRLNNILRPSGFQPVLPAKVGLGVPFYCRKWTGTMVPMTQGSFGNPVPTISFRELSNAAAFDAAYQQYDQAYKASYIGYNPLNQFITYVSPQQITDMQMALVKGLGLGGWSEFTLNDDSANFDLAKAVYATALGGGIEPPAVVLYKKAEQTNGDILFIKQ